VPQAQGDAGAVAGGDRRDGVGQGQAQRLFAKHMLASRRRSHDLRRVQAVRRAEDDGVDGGVRQQCLEIIRECQAVRPREGGGTRVDVGGCGDPRDLAAGEGRHDRAAPPSEPNDAGPQDVHCARST